jgi:hypothetical protein
LNKPMLSSGG